MAPGESGDGERSRVAVVTPGGARPDWAPATGAGTVLERVDPVLDDEALAESLGATTAAFIDAGVPAPLSLARRIHRLAPGIQLAVVAAPQDRARLQHSMLFAPGLGELWVVLADDVTPALLGDAAEIGRRRRSHAARAPRVARQVADLEGRQGRRPFLPDQYLATLVELLPDPVLALDESGDVVFANPSAAEVLGVERSPSVSSEELRRALRPVDPDAWDDLLARGRDELVRGEIEIRSGEDRRMYAVAVGPVEGERPVRAVLLHDLTDQVESREALAARAEELRRAMEHRSRFYASMSHELRTPINAIVGYLDLIGAEVYGAVPSDQQFALERISRATRHLLDLVDDTLDLSKVESGKVRVRPERLDVRELVRDVRATMQALADESGASLEFDVHETCAGGFSTDPQRLRQIMANLLSNAIRYGGGQPVKVRCGIHDRRLVVEVEDQGPGIPASQRERIFEEFVQLDEGDSDGTGLGLPISRSLARALGGELSMESEEGRGSVFRIELPWLEEGEP